MQLLLCSLDIWWSAEAKSIDSFAKFSQGKKKKSQIFLWVSKTLIRITSFWQSLLFQFSSCKGWCHILQAFNCCFLNYSPNGWHIYVAASWWALECAPLLPINALRITLLKLVSIDYIDLASPPFIFIFL